MMDSVETIASAIPARIAVKRGGEEVQSKRLSGVAPYDITVRYDAITAAITTSDTVTDQHGKVYSVLWVGSLDEGRPRWITIMAESGTVANK